MIIECPACKLHSPVAAHSEECEAEYQAHRQTMARNAARFKTIQNERNAKMRAEFDRMHPPRRGM